MLGASTPAFADLIEQDFNTKPNGYTMMTPQTAMPEGWYFQKDTGTTVEWKETAGVDGTGCLMFQNASNASGPYTPAKSNLTYIIMEVKGGEGAYVSIDIKDQNSTLRTLAGLSFYKMTKDGDTFTQAGDALLSLNKAALTELGVNGSGWTTIKVDIDEDCWLGIQGNCFYVDNFKNAYGDLSTVDPEPGPGDGDGDDDVMKITQDFNDCTIGWTLTPSMLPEGWYMSIFYDGKVQSPYDNLYSSRAYFRAEGVGGSTALVFDPSNKEDDWSNGETTVITLAKGSAKSTVSVDLYNKNTSVNNCYVYKMTKDEDGIFTKGELLTTFAMPSKEWKTFTYEGPTEDCYIGFTGNYYVLDNYVNTYVAGPVVYTVSGTVTDNEANALAGAAVTFPGYEPVLTDENGAFTLAGVAADTYNVAVSAPGYNSTSKSVEVTADVTDLSFELEPQVSTLTAKVAISQNYEYIAVPGATVTLYEVLADDELKELSSVVTDEEGMFSVSVKGLLNPQGYRLTASAPYYETKSTKVYVDGFTTPAFKQGEVKTYGALAALWMVAEKLSFKATITDTDENAMINGTVTIWPKDNAEAVLTATDNGDGTYTVSNISAVEAAENVYVASAVVDGYKEQTKEFSFAGKSVEETFALTAWLPTQFTGLISDEDGNPIEDAEVLLIDPATEETVAQDKTIADGVYTIIVPGALADAYTLKVSAKYYDTVEKTITAPERESKVETDAVLDKEMYTFNGKVTNAAGEAIEDAQVALGAVELTADAEGVYSHSVWSKDAEDTTYTVQAVADGYEPVSHRFSFTESVYDYTFVLGEVKLTFTGHIMDSEYEPIDGANMSVSCEGEDIELTDLGDGDYTFEIAMLKAQGKTFTVKAFAPGYVEQTETFSFTGENEMEAELYFTLVPEIYTYTATVKGVNDVLLTDAEVVVKADDEAVEVTNNNDGTYSFSVEAPKTFGVTYTVEVSAKDYFSSNGSFTFEDGSVEQEFTLTYDNSVNSIVMGENGVSNAGGKLFIKGDAYIYAIDGRLVKAVSNAETEQVDLPAGLYIVAGQKVLVK